MTPAISIHWYIHCSSLHVPKMFWHVDRRLIYRDLPAIWLVMSSAKTQYTHTRTHTHTHTCIYIYIYIYKCIGRLQLIALLWMMGEYGVVPYEYSKWETAVFAAVECHTTRKSPSPSVKDLRKWHLEAHKGAGGRLFGAFPFCDSRENSAFAWNIEFTAVVFSCILLFRPYSFIYE